MLKFLLKIIRRLKRILKVQATTRQKYVPSVRARAIRTILLCAAALAIVFLYPAEDLYDPFDTPRLGDIAREDIIAPFPIVIRMSQQEYVEEQDRVRYSVPLVLEYDTLVVQEVTNDLRGFVDLVDSLRRSDPNPSPGKLDEFYAVVSNRYPLLSQTAINRSLMEIGDLQQVHARLRQVFDDEIYHVGFLDSANVFPHPRTRTATIRGVMYQRDRLLDKPLAYGRLLTVLNRMAAEEDIDVDYYYQIGKNFIRPNLKVDFRRYRDNVSDAVAHVSDVMERVEEGDIIVRSGRKVSARQESLLREMARIQRAQAAEEGGFKAYLPLAGRIALVLALFSALYLFLYHFRREVFNSNPRLLALLLVFVIQMLLIYLIDQGANMLNIQSMYVYPVAILPIIVTILFDAEIGILATIVLALLLGVMHRFSFVVSLLTVVVGTVACFSTRRVRKRSDYYRIMMAVVLAYVAFIFFVENLKLSPGSEIQTEVLYGAVVGLLSIVLTIFLIPFFESLFGFTTDITLLELSDLNHPLLKRLALEAPGTYHHSIIVGNLSEAAAKEIGANALLARVGTYYHDIGKIEVPEYFVENQLSVTSKHEDLTPSMSALILASHVKKGRALGEEAGIPDDVLNFIEEHHGTMVMSYFYNKALEQGEDESAMDKFRYPGPKPQRRETGIAMLADAAEAASRTLDDPKPARIQSLIQRIINDRFQSGELDECPLTLRDLAKVREAFAQVLMAAFHQRVKYPKKEGSAE